MEIERQSEGKLLILELDSNMANLHSYSKGWIWVNGFLY